jgi:hypothetical protein
MNVVSQCNKTLIVILLATSIARISLFADDRPAMRPALVGSGPKSLINLIGTKHLMERGVQHGAMYFMARVDPNGYPSYSRVWGTTKGLEALRDEVTERLAEARFVPAVYNHQNVYAWFYGTLAFSVVDGKPHLRIFANQELSELQKESDFIAPQAIWLPGKIYDTAKWKNPYGTWSTEDKGGAAVLLLSVDASGKIKNVSVDKVDPPDRKSYAEESVKRVEQWLCLPAYRNGKPVESTTHFKYFFVPWFERLL